MALLVQQVQLPTFKAQQAPRVQQGLLDLLVLLLLFLVLLVHKAVRVTKVLLDQQALKVSKALRVHRVLLVTLAQLEQQALLAQRVLRV